LIGARGSWRKVSYEDAFYDGARLKDELDRSATSAAVTLRHELTPLTTVTFSAGRSEQRFTSSSRSSESDDYSVSFNFDPRALLRGSATFGYTRYKPESADLRGYEGATFDVSLAYALADSTRFTATMSRAIDFSYNNDQPYYVLSGGGGSIAQHIAGPVDAIARAGAYRLKYTSRGGASFEMVDRTDRVRSYGGGVGFRVGGNLRLGFNIDKERRTSILEKQTYEGLKYGASLTYGL
jgi:hypothetical protein